MYIYFHRFSICIWYMFASLYFVFCCLVILKAIHLRSRLLTVKWLYSPEYSCSGTSLESWWAITESLLCVCFRWFRPWPVTGPTPYGNTVSWTLLRYRAVAGNPTPRIKSSKCTPYTLSIHRKKVSHTYPHSSLLEKLLSLLCRNVIKPFSA